MSDLKQAQVDWRQFGTHHKGILGEHFEDGGERLAMVTCPWCGGLRSLEYLEYMQLLRLDEISCPSCQELYTLRPISSLRSNKKNKYEKNQVPDFEDHDSNIVRRPTEKPDDTGRRDWGKA